MISTATKAMWVNRLKACANSLQLGKIADKLGIGVTLSSFVQMIISFVLWIFILPFKIVLSICNIFRSVARNGVDEHVVAMSLLFVILAVFIICVGVLFLKDEVEARPATADLVQKYTDGQPCVKEKLTTLLAQKLKTNQGPLTIADVKGAASDCSKTHGSNNEIESQKNVLGVK